jgi:hypothetical protein
MESDYPSIDAMTVVAHVVSAYIVKNNVRPADLGSLIERVHASFSTLSTTGEPSPEPLTPAVSIRKSIAPAELSARRRGRPDAVREDARSHWRVSAFCLLRVLWRRRMSSGHCALMMGSTATISSLSKTPSNAGLLDFYSGRLAATPTPSFVMSKRRRTGSCQVCPVASCGGASANPSAPRRRRSSA